MLGGVLQMLNVGMVLFGFHVDKVTDIPDVNGRLWRLTYEKNGAELVWLERKDDVKTFVIAFKTLPDDDTGVAHILEHSVLSGSEKYPVKSPFAELCKSSLRVFMNAMTSQDKTYYPFSTRNDQDFLNLADVYLDAVFHPRVLKSPLAFRQEGWHYEIDQKTGELIYNGVVYNEMKGVFADPERTAGREVLHYLYPDIVYGNDSGGKPQAIPSLTYEKFCAFYRKFYHPTNARIFLDGSVDLLAVLAKLDSFLSGFERAEKVAAIPLQNPVSCKMTIPYASSDCSRKTILADAWSVGDCKDLVQQAALDVLVEYLAGSNESPLKKNLLSKGLCDDVRLYWYDYQQLPLVLILRNTREEQAGLCRETVRETISKLLENGLDHTRIRALINAKEFSEREVNSSRPRGLVFFSRAIRQWLYDGDPAAAFDLTGIFTKLREGVDKGLFEKCLRESFIENSHHVELTYVPSKTCGDETARKIAEELSSRRAKMSPNDLEALNRDVAELAAYQNRKDAEAAKATIPVLHLSDIPQNGRLVEHTIETNGTVTVITTRPTTDGIAYASVYFSADDLDADDLLMLPLLASLYGKLPTAQHDALALQTQIAATIGRLKFSAKATERGNFLAVDLAVLSDKGEDAVNLLKEILMQTKFEDTAAVAKILKQKCISIEREVLTRGDSMAGCYAAKGLSRRWASRDLLNGYAQLRWLQSANADSMMVRRLAALAARIVDKEGMVLSVTDNLPLKARERLTSMAVASDGKMITPSALECSFGSVAGVKIDGDAGYSGTVAGLPSDVGYDGSMRVAAKMLSLGFLHKQVREIGGAYGTALSILPNGLISSYTYRDPKPVESVATIRRVGDELLSFARSGECLDRYIVATVASMDPYRPPAQEADRPIELYLAKRTPEDVEKERRQVLSTTHSDLERVAKMLQERMKESHSLVVGGAKQMLRLPVERVELLRPE